MSAQCAHFMATDLRELSMRGMLRLLFKVASGVLQPELELCVIRRHLYESSRVYHILKAWSVASNKPQIQPTTVLSLMVTVSVSFQLRPPLVQNNR